MRQFQLEDKELEWLMHRAIEEIVSSDMEWYERRIEEEWEKELYAN